MLFANRCNWAHLVASAAALLQTEVGQFLSGAEAAAVTGAGDPRAVR
jgi:hypothetical protein